MANTQIFGMGFHHIALKCADIHKSLAMYHALGMTEVVRWGEGEGLVVMLDVGDGGRIELFAGGTPNTAENEKWLHFALYVNDVDTAYQTALAAGFISHIAPKIATPFSTPAGLKLNVAFVKGPDGELVEFFKEL